MADKTKLHVVESFSIVTGQQGDCVVARLSGELDMAVSYDLQWRLREAIDLCKPPLLVIDTSNLTFCDSSGLSVLLKTLSVVRALGGQMALSGVGHRLAKVLAITGLDRRFETYPTIGNAVAVLSASPKTPGL